MFEIYLFIDPLSTLCFNIEKEVIKLAQKKQRFHFRFIPIVNLQTIEQTLYYHLKNQPTLEQRNLALQNTYAAALTIKAAELQGRKYGVNLLLKMQQQFLHGNRVSSSGESTEQWVREIGADVEFFLKDRTSDWVKEKFLRDQQLAKKIDLQYLPTAILFDFNSKEDGIIIEDYLLETLTILSEEPITSIYQALDILASHHGTFVKPFHCSNDEDWNS